MTKTGDLIKKLRITNKMGQQELAQLIGISNTYLSRIENGKNKPSLVVTNRLANALHVFPRDFLEGEDNEPLLDILTQITNKKARIMLDLIKYVECYRCHGQYDMSATIKDDNFEDLSQLVIDVVISRMKKYQQNAEKEEI